MIYDFKINFDDEIYSGTIENEIKLILVGSYDNKNKLLKYLKYIQNNEKNYGSFYNASIRKETIFT